MRNYKIYLSAIIVSTFFFGFLMKEPAKSNGTFYCESEIEKARNFAKEPAAKEEIAKFQNNIICDLAFYEAILHRNRSVCILIDRPQSNLSLFLSQSFNHSPPLNIISNT